MTAAVTLRASGRFFRCFTNLLACVILLFICSQGLSAQVLFGSVVGNVVDASGAAVPGATVKITETSTNESRSVRTNDAGVYTVTTVAAGTYRIEIAKTGFSGFMASDVVVNQNNVVRVDAQLQVGTQAERVEVTTTASAELQTERADIHAEIATAGSGKLTAGQPNLRGAARIDSRHGASCRAALRRNE